MSATAPSSASESCRSAAVSCAADGAAALEQHRPGVEARVELHDGHAGLRVAGEDRALDGRGAAPARQQRTVDVHAAEPRQIERRLRKDEAIGNDDEHVRRPLREFGTALGRLEGLGCATASRVRRRVV